MELPQLTGVEAAVRLTARNNKKTPRMATTEGRQRSLVCLHSRDAG
jgi:hypothetical protein